ncbi:kinase-like domain-containing protein [Glomus cerebriforme]|uniref:Kinase-like domain-containing protein n=1 Tax=Glomus cerebriforme TaxID=658196 RepID=A0A397SE68_9GLOM|nr:kinase-like domain-containing protein [Glomus cerebriforme]
MNQSRECIECKQIINIGYELCQICFDLKSKEKKYGRCIECKQINMGENWCQICNSKRFQQEFNNWTSGNNDVDKFIKNIQLSAKNYYQLLEWIPYERFYKIVYVAEGGFGKVYRANWKDGYISHWDTNKHQWRRHSQNRNDFVALKSLDNSQNVKLEFLNEITLHIKVIEDKLSNNIIRCYGITQDPNTKDYMMVMKYAKLGSLRNVLVERRKRLHKDKKKLYKMNNFNLDLYFWKWRYKVRILECIAAGLYKIHRKGLIHRDLHIGNIVCFRETTCITDMGLCKPANYNELENNIYGVLAYVAPEILRGQNYTQASDIYSFGIIMYEIISELSPYHDVAHDPYLAGMICKGLRPKFNIEVPPLILHLIKSCLDANPSDRPTAKLLSNKFQLWLEDLNKYIKNIEDQVESIKVEFIKQIEEAEKINNSSSASNLTNKLHPEAIYTSRLLNFNNLPEQKNSDDYYKNYHNISSIEYSDLHRKLINEAPEFSWSSNENVSS